MFRFDNIGNVDLSLMMAYDGLTLVEATPVGATVK